MPHPWQWTKCHFQMQFPLLKHYLKMHLWAADSILSLSLFFIFYFFPFIPHPDLSSTSGVLKIKCTDTEEAERVKKPHNTKMFRVKCVTQIFLKYISAFILKATAQPTLPNASNGTNLSLWSSKRWIFFPPSYFILFCKPVLQSVWGKHERKQGLIMPQ